MAFKDFREWISFLEREGELLRLDREIAPEPDVGAIGRAICDMEGPGALLENVRGFKMRLAIGLHASWRRANAALGLPREATRREQTQFIMNAYDRHPLKPVMRDSGACQENIVTGDAVNLFHIPIPRINKDDASFYITKPMCITKDPETGWVNVGMYRMMVQERNRIAIHLTPQQHIGHHYAKYIERGQPMPMAVALGTEPVLPMVAGAKIPAGWNEYDFAGALRGEPLDLVRGSTVDLPVPAHAEIVLEGVVRIDELKLEAPFGEFHGAYGGYQYSPIFEVNAITFRTDPIYDHLYLGRSYSEADYMTTCTKLAGLWRDIKPKFPQITEISLLNPYWYVCVAQGRWRHTGEPRLAMFALWAHGIANKFVICVDEDVDPWSAQDVLWAVGARSQGDKDFVIVPDTVPALDPSQSLHHTTCKVGIDATKSRPPYHRSEPVGWIAPPEKTEEWKKIIGDLWSGTKAH
jgi:UbiD family decarboxylase